MNWLAKSLSARRSSKLRWSLLLAGVLWSINAWACSLHDLSDLLGQGDEVVAASTSGGGSTAPSGSIDVKCPHIAGAHVLPASVSVPSKCLGNRPVITVQAAIRSLGDLGAAAPPTPPPIRA